MAPGCETTASRVTNSPLESQAGMSSEVPVPGPRTSPPAAKALNASAATTAARPMAAAVPNDPIDVAMAAGVHAAVVVAAAAVWVAVTAAVDAMADAVWVASAATFVAVTVWIAADSSIALMPYRMPIWISELSTSLRMVCATPAMVVRRSSP
ncbi:hypothetical protein D3C78_1475550 [compost metagenome]